MSDVRKGKVYEIETSGKVRVQNLSGRGLSSPLIETDGRILAVGDIVSFIVFDDGSGVIIGGGELPAAAPGDGSGVTPISNIELEQMLGA